MNNILLILGIIALSNGNISLGELSLFDNNKNKMRTKKENISKSNRKRNSSNQKKKVVKESINKEISNKKINVDKKQKNRSDNILGFNMNDINQGIKLMELSDEDLERGMEIITRTKKYMSRDEKKVLVKVESLLDLVRGIKKLSSIEDMEEDETNFFRSMDDEDKKNMMIKEILEVFPEKRRDSVEKAIDMKKKIDIFAELFLPDDFGEGGFSLSSLANISNLGSMGNLNLLGSLLRNEQNDSKYQKYKEYEYENQDDYEYYDDDEYEDFSDYDEYESEENNEITNYIDEDEE